MSEALVKLMQSPVEYRGQRVVSLPQMDAVHERPRGTAGRNFRQHRDRFVQGVHYFEVPPDQTTNFVEWSGKRGFKGSVIVLTERGYLVLVRTFNDDLAWKVQDQLVEGYFRAQAPSDPFTVVCGLLAQVERTRQTDKAHLQAQVDDLRRAFRNGGRLAAFPNAYGPLRRKKKAQPQQLEIAPAPKRAS